MAGFDSGYKSCLSQAHLICTLCDGPFKKPVILPCFHAFCRFCWNSHRAEMKTKSEQSCPTCQTVVSSEDIHKLPAVHFLQTLQDVIKSNRFERRACCNCRQDKYAVWMCDKCQDTLCGECKETHLNHPGKERHTEFEFLDNTVKEICQRRNDFHCDDHPDEILAYYCKTCSGTICVVCESTGHDHHLTERISHQADVLRKQISDVVDTSTSEFRRIMASKEKQADLKLENWSKIEKQVQDWVQQLKDQLDQKSKDLLQEAKSAIDSNSPSFGELSCKNLNAISVFPKQLCDYGSDVEVINLADAVTNKLKALTNLKQNEDENVRLNFSPDLQIINMAIVSVGIINNDNEKTPRQTAKPIGQQYDKVKISPESVPSKGRDNTRVKQIGSFQARWDVTGIGVTRQGQYLVNSRLNKACLIYDKSGNLLKEITLHGQNPFDVTVTNNGNCVITDRETKRVNVFSNEGNFIETLNMEIGEPGGIASLSNGDLVISDLKQKDVCVFSPHRKMFPLRSLKTENGNHTFKWPLYIAVNTSDEIIVSDNELHSVKIFDKKGKLRARYGNHGDSGEQLRGPRGVCTDARDNIFVTDYTNDRIHMLDANCSFLRILICREDGLSGPRVVAIDTENRLIIGQENASIKIIEYLQ